MRKLKPKQKIYVAVAVVAVAALAADRLFLGAEGTQPVGAGAAEPAVASLVLPGGVTPGDAADQDTPGQTQTSVITRLAVLGSPSRVMLGGVRDACRPPVAWLPELQKPVVEEPEALVPETDPGEEFQKAHHLRAIVYQQDRPKVIVDHRCLGVGDSLGPFVLESIGTRSAVFTDCFGEVILTMPKTSAP